MGSLSIGILAILGIGVFGGIVGATVFQRLRIPQVVGYIAMGLLIGEVGFGLVDAESIENLDSLNLFLQDKKVRVFFLHSNISLDMEISASTPRKNSLPFKNFRT